MFPVWLTRPRDYLEILKTATSTQKQERSWHALEFFEQINIQVDLNRLRQLYAQGNPALTRNPELSQFYNFKYQQVGTSNYNIKLKQQLVGIQSRFSQWRTTDTFETVKKCFM